eukprot:7149633-Pyramimonas_sp.AAC.2
MDGQDTYGYTTHCPVGDSHDRFGQPQAGGELASRSHVGINKNKCLVPCGARCWLTGCGVLFVQLAGRRRGAPDQGGAGVQADGHGEGGALSSSGQGGQGSRKRKTCESDHEEGGGAEVKSKLGDMFELIGSYASEVGGMIPSFVSDKVAKDESMG